jgi:hypothetical protein
MEIFPENREDVTSFMLLFHIYANSHKEEKKGCHYSL